MTTTFRKFPFLLAAVVSALALSAPAMAQEAAGEGADGAQGGLRFGGFRLVPGLTIEGAYDSNVNNRPDENTIRRGNAADPSEELGTGDMILRFTAGLRLIYPSRKVAFAIGGTVGYNQYLGLSDTNSGATTSDLSHLNATAALGVNFFPEGVVTFSVRDRFFYVAAPDPNPLTFRLLQRMNNEATGELRYQPGGLRGTMKYALRYTFGYEQYQDDLFAALNTMKHDIQLHGEWFFLPRTAMFFMVGLQMTDFFDAEVNPAAADTTAQKSSGGLAQYPANAMPIRLDVGLIGQVGRNWAINVSANYQYTNAEYLESYPYPGGRAEITWQAARRSQLRLGFRREATVTSLYGYYASNLLYAGFRQWAVNDRLRLGLSASFDYQTFGNASSKLQDALDAMNASFGIANPCDPATPGYCLQADRTDMVITANPYITYLVTDWFNLGASYRLMYRASDGSLSTPPATDAANNTVIFESNFDLVKHEIMLTFNFSY